MDLELKQELEVIKTSLETKTATEVKNAIDAFETKLTASIKSTFDNEIKSVREQLEAKFQADLAKVQEHADKLDMKLQEAKTETKVDTPEGVLSKLIADNIDNIKEVRAGKEFSTKAVGNMTLSNVSGTMPRNFNMDVVKFPSQMVNVADLAGLVTADTGIYTYVVEGAGEGSISAQTEGSSKSQRDYDFTHTDVSTNFIAGFARYSKKMRNNLSYIQNTIPQLLVRDYWKAENAAFNTILAGAATASTEIITGSTKSKMLINEIGKLENNNYTVNGIVVRPSDYLDILKTAKMDLESAVTYENGILRVAGAQVLKATWLTANKYFVGDWTRVNKVVTEGLSVEFSEVEGTNFVTNNITARVEAQVSLAVEQTAAIVYGDFTATA